MMTDNTCMVQVQEIKGLRADGVLNNFGLKREFHWRIFGQEFCIVLFYINNLVKVYIYREFFYCLR